MVRVGGARRGEGKGGGRRSKGFVGGSLGGRSGKGERGRGKREEIMGKEGVAGEDKREKRSIDTK